jgi:hypothetical protein
VAVAGEDKAEDNIEIEIDFSSHRQMPSKKA